MPAVPTPVDPLAASLAPPEQLPPHVRTTLEAIAPGFVLGQDYLRKITSTMLEEFAAGLSQYGEPMAMIPTYVTGVPNGSETGTFLALDLGGTNLRVCEVKLLGNKKFELRQQKYKVSDTLKTGEAVALFNYMADCVDVFLTENQTNVQDGEDLYLGFTFSFPVEQRALASGELLTWTKGFSAKNAVGQDVGKLMQEAFDRRHMHVKCVAIVNDTVGTLLTRAYTGGGCILGAIFGTGTNGAYVEDVSRISKFANHPAAAKGGSMVVNCEWGAFNNTRSVMPTTPFDNKLDRESINVRKQAFEKFISGMYQGEILRNIILHLIDSVPAILFKGESSPAINKHYGIDTAVMSDIERAKTLEEVQQVVVSAFGLPKETVGAMDAWIVRWATEVVGTRAAKLSACAVAAILVQTGHAHLEGANKTSNTPLKTPTELQIGVDGSMCEFYPHFEERLRDALRSLVGEEVERRTVIGLAKDGSGVGAALCALQAVKQV
ncbi:hexokinase-domain-containing protein [Auriculariales sp. MPI-PUGE-AT-0066]|nr:hexokinase-domain-containing protein [Auriculariales sp. MPI-PUGE-AT-0066]